jgi:hypothetical protein
MAKNVRLWKLVQEKLNPVELETLGITAESTKEELETILEQSKNIERNPDYKPDQGLTQAASDGSTEETGGEETGGEETGGEEKPKVDGDEFDVLLGKIKGAEPGTAKEKETKGIITKEKRKRKKGESSPDSFRVEGYILLLATDTLFPTLLSVINNMIDKKHRKIEVSELRLSQLDFDKLEPLANQAADYMSINLNPIAGFFIVSAFMYTNNIIALKMNPDSAKIFETPEKK